MMFTQILGSPGCGKTLLATLLAKEHDTVYWVSASQELSQGLWDRLQWRPTYLSVTDDLEHAFSLMRVFSGFVDCVVLDSLAAMRSVYTHRQTVVSYNMLFENTVPVIVVNQQRHPRAPGGSVWHGLARTYNLVLYRRRPALYTHVSGLLWLVWWPDLYPSLRSLQAEDWDWLPMKGEAL
jgi:hypothetical protein